MHNSQIEHITSSGPFQNWLLRSLAPGDARLLKPHLSRVAFGAGEIITAPDMAIDKLFFPETIIVAFREAVSTDHRTDVGVIGNEGMIGWPLLLGSRGSRLMGISQNGGGTALAIGAKPLMDACMISPSLQAALLRFVHNFMLQMAGTILSAGDTVERRVARWVLMLHDRSDGDQLALTHDHIGDALNVRRASVTDCLHLLEGEGLLKCTRGRILVRDRARLEALAGSSYGATEAHYLAEIGAFSARTPERARAAG